MNREIGIDPILAALNALPTYDLTASRTHRLRARCHTVLRATGRKQAEASADVRAWWQTLGPLLLGAWCVTYLVGTVLLAIRVYGS
jgi:hypothetical protein